jgi:hypothetical protein
MDRYNKYQTVHTHTHTHTAHTLVGGQYSAGWPPRNTIRSSESMRRSIEKWSVDKYIKITILHKLFYAPWMWVDKWMKDSFIDVVMVYIKRHRFIVNEMLNDRYCVALDIFEYPIERTKNKRRVNVFTNSSLYGWNSTVAIVFVLLYCSTRRHTWFIKCSSLEFALQCVYNALPCSPSMQSVIVPLLKAKNGNLTCQQL